MAPSSFKPYGNCSTAFAEPAWYTGLPSPYYQESHIRLRAAVRKWTEKYLVDQAHDWAENYSIDPETYQQAATDGLLLPQIGGSRIPKEWTKYGKIIADIKPEEWNGFHDLIVQDEMTRCGASGSIAGLFAGISYAAPLIWKYASTELKERILPSLLDGSKRICIAITEPDAGSDVKNLSTSAVRSPDGKHWIVTGTKKWITNGIWSDYFATAVRTRGKPGDPSGISVLIIPFIQGVKVSKMFVGGGWASGTSRVIFNQVEVPIENLVGVENEGFKYIMSNFNHERLNLAFLANRLSRICIEDSIGYASKRQVFGAPLIELGVIRNKLGHMARLVESQQAWIEALVYQLDHLSPEEGSKKLGGQTALLKAHCSTVLEYAAREAVQIFGGLGYTRGGLGEKVERIWREVKSVSIPGGSEEVMLDLGVRQQMKIALGLSSKL
ncbi:acyl-CoA dehydrogenase/oxidase [Melampsora americana]|nr:acyl-CoA dehydrogenase/oxidase [Melampsora americana]